MSKQYESVDLDDKDLTSLSHYGMPRRSGRYPWGSGEDPYQHGSRDFIARVEEYKSKGLSQKEMADAMGMSTTEFRTKYNIANTQRKLYEADTVKTLKYKYGLSNTEIGRRMGKNESSIRSILNTATNKNLEKNNTTADFLMQQIKEKKFIDVGPDAGRELGISNSRLESALKIIQAKGYNVYGGRVPYVTDPNGPNKLSIQVACGPKATYFDVFGSKEKYGKDGAALTGDVQSLAEYSSTDGGKTYKKAEYPSSIDRSRVFIRYGDKGGNDLDGTIYIREGVKDLSLGNSRYAQVRIGVDDKYYMKGMAMYSKDIPKGYDIAYNVNKKEGTPDEKVFKEMKKDNQSNPFGVYMTAKGQNYYDDPNGKYVDPETGKKQSLSPINKLKEEGEWINYNKKTPAQFLSKQNTTLARTLLNNDIDDHKAYYDEIKSVTNPTLKKYLLDDFAKTCDKAAYQLKAAALPRQAYEVILPIPTLKNDECYAPQFKDGEKLALIRFPHGGTFEIPILKNNLKNSDGIDVLHNAKDAVGINKNNADRLSGADFDGDTVLVVPTGKNKLTNITSTPLPKLLEGYDPKDTYNTVERYTGKKDEKGNKIYEYLNKDTGTPVKIMSEAYKQKQMGIVSNLITDMTLKGAPPEEIAMADRHSMTVIDAVKHHLDYQTSAKENHINELKKKWQVHTTIEGDIVVGGAATLISRAKNEHDVDLRQGSPRINKIGKDGKLEIPSLPEGAVYYKRSDHADYVDEEGNTKTIKQKSKQMLEVQDAKILSSGTQMENEYAKYANSMKALANSARKEMIGTGRLKVNKTAKETYADEVKSLNEKLELALINRPRERRAQNIASGVMRALYADNPELKDSKDKVKKIRQQALEDARASVSASSKDKKIEFTEREWQAIMAGAISETSFMTMMKKADKDKLMARALPKQEKKISDVTISRMNAYAARGYTTSQIAEALGISPTTVRKYI